MSEDTIHRNWKERWRQYVRAAGARHRPCTPESAEKEPDFDKDMLEKHQGLLKYESSILIQMKTGKIGLKAFLYKKGIPDMETPFCSCSQALETATHLAIECQETTEERRKLSIEIAAPMHTRHNFDLALKDPLMAGKVAKWMLRLGHLYQYKLAIHIDGESEELQKTEVGTAKKSRKHSATAIQETCSKASPTRDRTATRRHNNIEGQTACRADEPRGRRARGAPQQC